MHYGYQPRCSDKCCVLSWSDHLVACRPAMMSCDTGGYIRYLGYSIALMTSVSRIIVPVHIDTTVLRTPVLCVRIWAYRTICTVFENQSCVYSTLCYYIAYTLIVRMYCSACTFYEYWSTTDATISPRIRNTLYSLLYTPHETLILWYFKSYAILVL